MHFVAVFGYGSSGYVVSFVVELPSYLCVGKRRAFIFGVDELFDYSHYFFIRYLAAFIGLDSVGEEIPQREDTVSCLYVFIACGSRYGRKVEAYDFGNILKLHRYEV